MWGIEEKKWKFVGHPAWSKECLLVVGIGLTCVRHICPLWSEVDLSSATTTETLPTVKNCPMDCEGRPRDIKPFPLLLNTPISFP